MSVDPLQEIRDFYCQTYRPLYDFFYSACDKVPQELHFEVAATLDHIMRESVGSKEFTSEKACSHLKRATLDGFKVLFEQVRGHHKRLSNPMYKWLDNGEFLEKIENLWHKARDIRAEARGFEIREEWDAAFEKWQPLREVYEKFCAIAREKKVLNAKLRVWQEGAKWFLGILLGALLTWFAPKLFG